jgi:hypothetical protein
MMNPWRRGGEMPGKNHGDRPSSGRILPGPGLALLAARALLLVLLLPAAGCLFTTRTPETPLDNGVPWKNPSDPESVLTNISVTFNAKQVPNYGRSLTEDFTFSPFAGEVSSGDPTRFDNWRKQDDVDAFGSAFGQTRDGIVFTWTLPHPERKPPPGSPADLYFENLKYKMVFTHPAGAKTFQGMVDLYFRQGSDGWSIYRWVDKKDPGDTAGNFTLTKLRVDPSSVN